MTDRTFMHEAEYRGESAMNLIANKQVTICGAGAVGSNLADNLARTGFRQLKVIDADRVEQHNIGNQAYDLSDIGGWKAEILRNRLFRACEAEVEIVTKRLDGNNAGKFLRNSELVIDAFDNSDSRAAIQNQCRADGIDCLHVGLFEDYCEVIWDDQYRVPGDVDGDVCEYPLARNLVCLSVAIASEAIVRYVVDGLQESSTATLKDFSVRPFQS